MTLKNKLAVGLAVFTMGGTALASDASADRAAALQAKGAATEVRPIAVKKATPPASAASERPCDRKDCCAMMRTPAAGPAPAPTSTAPAFTDFG